MADKAKARLSGRFPAGTEVGLYRDHIGGGTLRADDARLSGAIKTATVGDDQSVEFDGLDDGERLFIGGYVEEDVPRPGEKVARVEWRSVSITAQVPQRREGRLSPAEQREALAQTLSAGERMPDRTSVGTRDSRALTAGGMPIAAANAGKPTPEGAPDERVPHLRQEDAVDVEQRSATITGQATPVDPGEQVPKPKQIDGIDMEQRSATARGELTPVSPGEQVPHPTQAAAEDLEQRSATRLGQAEPVPQGDPVEIQRAKESSAAKAIGNPADSAVVQAAIESEVSDDGEVEFGEKVSGEPSNANPLPVGHAPVNESADPDAASDPESTWTDVSAVTTTELKARARELDIDGRSSMSRRQLQNAVKRAEGQS